ncbi:MAG: dephospho-CoA kinase [Verrucomicrobiota bacterium]
MFVLAVTGGVASGKSLFSDLFVDLASVGSASAIERFDCDRCVHSLLKDPEILLDLKEIFGQGVFGSDGNLDRAAMRERVFACDDDRRRLEGLLHPRVLSAAEQMKREVAARDEPPGYLLFEVPLLYEVDFSLQRDTDVVVATSLESQRQRLRDRRALADDVIELILKAQLSMEEKISRAQQVIWNDAGVEELTEQAYLLKAWIDKKGR